MRHLPKWRARSDVPSTMDPFVSSSEAVTEDEVTHPIDWDRANAVVRKRKGTKGASSQCESHSKMT
jgi:hypothetical protein